MNKTPEDEEFERIERESGWRKRQIALDQKAENAKELGLGYEPVREPRWKEWHRLTDEEIQQCLNGLPTQTIDEYARRIEAKLKEKNT